MTARTHPPHTTAHTGHNYTYSGLMQSISSTIFYASLITYRYSYKFSSKVSNELWTYLL